MRRKDRGIAELTDIAAVLESCKVCHLGMVDASGRPYVVPMNYGYEFIADELRLYFHSAPEGRKIDILKSGAEVCFEVCSEGEPQHPETPCHSGYYFSSVMGCGHAEFITAPEEKCAALTKLFYHQTGLAHVFSERQAGGVCVFRLVCKSFTGKKKPK